MNKRKTMYQPLITPKQQLYMLEGLEAQLTQRLNLCNDLIEMLEAAKELDSVVYAQLRAYSRNRGLNLDTYLENSQRNQQLTKSQLEIIPKILTLVDVKTGLFDKAMTPNNLTDNDQLRQVDQEIKNWLEEIDFITSQTNIDQLIRDNDKFNQAVKETGLTE